MTNRGSSYGKLTILAVGGIGIGVGCLILNLMSSSGYELVIHSIGIASLLGSLVIFAGHEYGDTLEDGDKCEFSSLEGLSDSGNDTCEEDLEHELVQLKNKLDCFQPPPPVGIDMGFEQAAREFIATFCVVEEGAQVSQKYIGHKYDEFCDENDITPERYKMYSFLESLTPDWVYRNDESHRDWLGIRLKNTSDWWALSRTVRDNFDSMSFENERSREVTMEDYKNDNQKINYNQAICLLAQENPGEFMGAGEWVDVCPTCAFKFRLNAADNAAARSQIMSARLRNNIGVIVARGGGKGLQLQIKNGKSRYLYGFFPLNQ